MPSHPIRLQHSLKSNISVRECRMKFIFCRQININVSYVLILNFWGAWSGMPSQPIRLQHSLKSNISVRKCRMKFIFCMQININVSYVLILKFFGGIVRHAQPANQIAVFSKVQYFNKEMK